VELALTLPLVAMLVLGVVQLALLVRQQVVVVDAARQAARAGAVDPDPSAPRRAALAGSGLDPARLAVDVARTAGRVEVRLHYADPTDVALIGPWLPDATLSGTAAMRDEGG
jgi:Flp pilus assembly protein TadG